MGILVDRLPEALKAQPVWVEIMECFEELFGHHIGRIEKANRAQSIFTADDDDLDLMIEEVGDIFDVAWNNIDDKPLSILWRKDELKFKTTSIPIESILQRSFVGLKAYWDEYYCKIGEPYTDANLFTKDAIDQLGHDLSEYFLTSRGFMRVDTVSMLDRGISQEEVTKIIRGQLRRIIPTHIVFDSIQFIISVVAKDMAINTRAEIKSTKVSGSAGVAINTKPEARPQRASAETPYMEGYARNEILCCDEVCVDFWPVDLPLIFDDGYTLVPGPIVVQTIGGQMGAGSTSPDSNIQLGDGQDLPSSEIQLGDGND